VLLGYLARGAGRLRLGLKVTELCAPPPGALIAQAMMTLAHMTKRPSLARHRRGERENIEPYGLTSPSSVGRLEEALMGHPALLHVAGTFDFAGKHYHLDRAVMDLQPPKGRTPEI